MPKKAPPNYRRWQTPGQIGAFYRNNPSFGSSALPPMAIKASMDGAVVHVVSTPLHPSGATTQNSPADLSPPPPEDPGSHS